MFKRRTPRSTAQLVGEAVWPRAGWARASRYVLHRLRRLPDPPHRVGRGIAAGVFVSFTPFFGAHFALALAIAWAIRGNLLAAALGTFIGNPVTTPFIAVSCVGLGRRMLGIHGHLGPQRILSEIAHASGEVAGNVLAVASGHPVVWTRLASFWHEIFLPYLVGGLIPGLLAALVCHRLTLPLVAAYHRRRAARLARRRASETSPEA